MKRTLVVLSVVCFVAGPISSPLRTAVLSALSKGKGVTRDREAALGGSMKQLASSRFASTGLLVLVFALTAGDTGQASGAPIASSTAQLSATVAADDLVMLERSFTSGRGPCPDELGVPTNRVFPDGTREVFVVPAGKALVLTDIEGEITRNSTPRGPSARSDFSRRR